MISYVLKISTYRIVRKCQHMENAIFSALKIEATWKDTYIERGHLILSILEGSNERNN